MTDEELLKQQEGIAMAFFQAGWSAGIDRVGWLGAFERYTEKLRANGGWGVLWKAIQAEAHDTSHDTHGDTRREEK